MMDLCKSEEHREMRQIVARHNLYASEEIDVGTTKNIDWIIKCRSVGCESYRSLFMWKATSNVCKVILRAYCCWWYYGLGASDDH
jgi:hypothetical protein